MKQELIGKLKLKIKIAFPPPLIFLLLFGILIRFYKLSSIFLYWDEPTHSVRIAYQSLSYVLAYNNASAFFSIILHFILPLGKIELMARLPSAVFGILLIPAIYFIGSYFFSKKTGFVAAALVTFSPFFIRFSQYSRTYSMFAFFAFLAFYFFFRAKNENKKLNWICYSIFMLLALYSHLMGFLALSGLGVFAGISWLISLKKDKVVRRQETKTAIRFIIFTLVVVLIAALLYIPDMNVRGFLTASADRVKNQTSALYLLPVVGKKILKEQILARTPYDSLLLFFVLLGLMSGLKKDWSKIFFFMAYILVPFLLFIAIKPRGVNIQSADRYFIFILPVIFLLAAQGISVVSSAITILLAKSKYLKPRKKLITAVFLSLLTVVCISGFDLKHYYLNFWRFGSYPVEKELRGYLQQNIKKDTLLYLDPSPAFGQLLALNPLSKKIKLNQNEAAIRKGVLAPGGGNQILIYRFELDSIKLYENTAVDLWAAVRINPEVRTELLSRLKKPSQVNFIRLNSYIIFKFNSGADTLSQRFLFLVRLLQSFEPDFHRVKEYHLLAARILLLNGEFDEAKKDLEIAQSIGFEELSQNNTFNPFSLKLIDRILGLSKEDLFFRYYDMFHFRNIGRHLYAAGEEFHTRKKFDQAYQAFARCLDLSREFDKRISRRFFLLGNNYLSMGNTSRAIPFYKKAVRLDPDRFILRFFLAEAYTIHGSHDTAERMFQSLYKNADPGSDLSRKIVHQDPLILASKIHSGWRLIFRAEKNVIFAGTITANKRLDEVNKIRFNNRDSITSTEKSVNLNFIMDKRRLKILEIKTSAKNQLTLEIKINGRFDKDKIVFLREKSN